MYAKWSRTKSGPVHPRSSEFSERLGPKKRYTQARVSKQSSGVREKTSVAAASPESKREGTQAPKLSPLLAFLENSRMCSAIADCQAALVPPSSLPTETVSGPVSRAGRSLAFDFAIFLQTASLIFISRHDWTMRRGRELITGGGGARTSHAYVILHLTSGFSSFGRSHADNSTSCATSRSRLAAVEHISCLLSGVDHRHNPCHAIHRRAFSSTSSSAINNDRNQRLIGETQNWLDRIVIGQKLCPFAPPVRSPPRLRLVASEATDADQLVEQISAEADLLVAGLLSQNGGDNVGDNNNVDTDDNDGISLPKPQPSSFPETTLVILDAHIFPAMSDYRNLIRLSWRIQLDCIVNRGHSDHLQLVLFHPLAVHDTYTEQPPGDDDDDDDDDCANYTIRSPHPTIHLLRQADVMRAARGGYADLECLPSRNKARLRGDGLEACRQRLEECSSSL